MYEYRSQVSTISTFIHRTPVEQKTAFYIFQNWHTHQLLERYQYSIEP